MSIEDYTRELLARKDAEIAQARAKRDGLKGTRSWRQPYGGHGIGPVPMPEDLRPITAVERAVITYTLEHGPSLARDIAEGSGFSIQAIRGCIVPLIAKAGRMGVRAEIVTIDQGRDAYGRRLMFVDTERARSLLA